MPRKALNAAGSAGSFILEATRDQGSGSGAEMKRRPVASFPTEPGCLGQNGVNQIKIANSQRTADCDQMQKMFPMVFQF